jgi:hypothetical protein
MNQWNLLTRRFERRILAPMALLDLNAPNAWRESDEIEVRLASFRAAIEEARRNGWRESDHLGDEMESYLAAFQAASVHLPVVHGEDRPEASPNPWMG